MNWVLERLRADSLHVSQLATIDGQIGHPGVKGRFRELLLNNLLIPWLPSGMACGTGLIIDHRQRMVDARQDDIVIVDPVLAPAVLASPNSTQGVYFYDSVLCRIEVKSTLRKLDLTAFVESSEQLAQLTLAVDIGQTPQMAGAMNMLVAFESEIAAGKELEFLSDAMTTRQLDPWGGIVSSMCVADRGFWLLGERNGERLWKALQISAAGDPLAYFTGVVSNTCFRQRSARQGLRPLGGGIGNYLDHPFNFVDQA